MGALSTEDENYQIDKRESADRKVPKNPIYMDLNRFIRGLVTPAPAALKQPAIQRWLDEEVHFGHTFLWFPIALIAGAYFNFTRQNDIPIAALILPFSILLTIRVCINGLSVRSKYIVSLGMAFIVGAIAVNLEHRGDFIILDQSVTTNVQGVVIAKEIGVNDMPRYKIEVVDTSNPRIFRSPTVIQLVARSSHKVFEVGEPIKGRARLSPPSGPVFPGGYDFSSAALQKNIGAYGFFYGKPEREVSSAPPKLDLRTKFLVSVNWVRSEIAYRIRQQLDGDAAGIASALIVSDRRAISKSAVESLRASGLAHVLAISGLHMVLASGTFFFALRLILSLFPTLVQSFPVKKIAAFGAIIAASSYLTISGAPISAQRAWIMLVIVLIAVLMDRPAITLRNVAIAAIVITVISPSAVMTPGFQMSFSAAAALVAVYTGWANFSAAYERSRGGIYDGFIFLVRFFIGLAATAIIAGLATGIFAVQHFYQFAGYGVLGNVLAMPIVTLLVMPLALLSVLLMPFGLETWPLMAMGWSIEIVIMIAEWVASLGSNIAIGKPSPIASFLASVGFVVFICFRSKLRFTGLALIGFSALGLLMVNPKIPDMLISEDGKLVGIRKSNTNQLSINRSRPSKFILDQWLDAYKFQIGKPIQLSNKQKAKELLSEETVEFWPKFDGLSNQTAFAEFKCVSSQFCYFENSEVKIATITDQRYLRIACDRANIVILSTRLKDENSTCDKNVMVLDQNSLRRTGSLALYRNLDKTSQSTLDWNIVSAINNSVRPWTSHRYYDWRSRSYKMPNGEIVKYHGLTNFKANAPELNTKTNDSGE